MRDKKILNYNIETGKIPVLIYFLIMLALISVTYIVGTVIGFEYRVSALEFATAIFLFIYGISSLLESFKLSQGFNLSRKKYLLGLIKSSIILSIVGAVITLIIYVFLNLFTHSQTILDSLVYFEGLGRVNMAINFIWFIVISFFSVVLGTFFAAIYYRVNNLGRVLISIAIGVFIIGINFIIIFFEVPIKEIVSYPTVVIGTLLVLSIIFTFFNIKIIKKMKVER